MDEQQVSGYVSNGYQARYRENPKKQIAANRKAYAKREWKKLQTLKTAMETGGAAESAKLAALGVSVKKVLTYMEISMEDFYRLFVQDAAVEFLFENPEEDEERAQA